MNTVSYDYREQKYYLIEYYSNNRRACARFFENLYTRYINRLKSLHILRFSGRLLNKRATVSWKVPFCFHKKH